MGLTYWLPCDTDHFGVNDASRSVPRDTACVLARAVRCAGAWPGFARGDLWGSSASRRAGSGSCQYISELMKTSTRQTKPKRLKTLVINELAHKAEKRTQACYQPWYQSLTAILTPILKKFGWIALPYCGFGAGRPQNEAGMSFRISKIALEGSHRRLGCAGSAARRQ